MAAVYQWEAPAQAPPPPVVVRAESYCAMTEAEVKDFFINSPDDNSVNRRDKSGKFGKGQTALYAAVAFFKSVSLIAWLIEEKGARVNEELANGDTPLHGARSLDILNALLDRGADPNKLNKVDYTPLMHNALHGRVELVARLLQDPRVRATADMQDNYNRSALFLSCYHQVEENATAIVRLLLDANANPTLPDRLKQETPLEFLRRLHPNYHSTIAALTDRTEVTNLLVNTRRLIFPEKKNTAIQLFSVGSFFKSFYLRAVRTPVPKVVVATDETDEEGLKTRKLMTFVLGLGGGARDAGMPPEVFRIMMDYAMPDWDPLRTLGGVKNMV